MCPFLANLLQVVSLSLTNSCLPSSQVSPVYPAGQAHCPVTGSHLAPLAQSHDRLQYGPKRPAGQAKITDRWDMGIYIQRDKSMQKKFQNHGINQRVCGDKLTSMWLDTENGRKQHGVPPQHSWELNQTEHFLHKYVTVFKTKLVANETDTGVGVCFDIKHKWQNGINLIKSFSQTTIGSAHNGYTFDGDRLDCHIPRPLNIFDGLNLKIPTIYNSLNNI